MATISNSDKVKYGFDSILNIFKAIPLFIPIIPIMLLLKYTLLGKLLYKRVATSRTIFSLSCDDECLVKK